MKNLIISSLFKQIVLLLIFITPVINFEAQNYKIIYEVNFKPVKEKDLFVKEDMVLKVIQDKSIFYNSNKERIDSLVNKFDYEGASTIQNSFLRMKIFKNFSQDLYTIGGNFNQFNYWYGEKKVKYYDIKKYGRYKEYIVNEAFADFGKRKWHLLYTNEIPINDGPYIFSGLPGLVIKAESLDGEYNFELVEIKKLTDQSELVEVKQNISKSKLIKNIKDFIKDPASHQINFKNDLGDSYKYEFSGVKDINYKTTNEYLSRIIKQFDNYPDKDVPIITF